MYKVPVELLTELKNHIMKVEGHLKHTAECTETGCITKYSEACALGCTFEKDREAIINEGARLTQLLTDNYSLV